MPIHHLPNGKYRWGNSGKEYSSKEDAEKQMKAAFANGYKGDSNEGNEAPTSTEVMEDKAYDTSFSKQLFDYLLNLDIKP